MLKNVYFCRLVDKSLKFGTLTLKVYYFTTYML